MEIYKNNHGLSLIEIVVTIAVIAILAAITISIVSRMDNQNNEKALANTFALLDGALEEYYEYWNGFPDPNLVPYTSSSSALYGQLSSTPGVKKYLEGISEDLIDNDTDGTVYISDPWGTLLDYRYISGNSFPELVSAGPDKTFNTVDDIRNK